MVDRHSRSASSRVRVPRIDLRGGHAALPVADFLVEEQLDPQRAHHQIVPQLLPLTSYQGSGFATSVAGPVVAAVGYGLNQLYDDHELQVEVRNYVACCDGPQTLSALQTARSVVPNPRSTLLAQGLRERYPV